MQNSASKFKPFRRYVIIIILISSQNAIHPNYYGVIIAMQFKLYHILHLSKLSWKFQEQLRFLENCKGLKKKCNIRSKSMLFLRNVSYRNARWREPYYLPWNLSQCWSLSNLAISASYELKLTATYSHWW